VNAARLIALATTAVATAACGQGDAASPTWAGTLDTIAGVEVVRNPGAGPAADAEAKLRPLWHATDTGPDGVWENPSRLAVGGGRVYVLDAQAHRVYVLDATSGDDLGSFGGEGGGPGELQRPFGIGVLGDRVVVGNNGGPRLDLFEVVAAGAGGGPVAYERSIRIDFLPFRLEPLPDGRLWLTGLEGREGVTWLLALDGTSEPFASPDTSVVDPEFSFEGCGDWSASADGLVRGCPKRFAFQELTLAGRVVREVTVDRPPVLASQAELDSLETTMRQSIGEVGMSATQEIQIIERMLERARVKAVYPVFRADTTTGHLYVLDETPAPGHGTGTLQVFDAERRHVAFHTLTESWQTFEVSAGRVYALVKDPDTGLAALAAYEVVLP
jgi:hypothetical protein